MCHFVIPLIISCLSVATYHLNVFEGLPLKHTFPWRFISVHVLFDMQETQIYYILMAKSDGLQK